MNDEDETAHFDEFKLFLQIFDVDLDWRWMMNGEEKRQQLNDSDHTICLIDGSKLFKGEFKTKLCLKEPQNVSSKLYPKDSQNGSSKL